MGNKDQGLFGPGSRPTGRIYSEGPKKGQLETAIGHSYINDFDSVLQQLEKGEVSAEYPSSSLLAGRAGLSVLAKNTPMLDYPYKIAATKPGDKLPEALKDEPKGKEPRVGSAGTPSSIVVNNVTVVSPLSASGSAGG